ncbi:putative aminodeoxychorismate lyase [compost metagenome]
MPGKASIEAALNPKSTDYLYFVAKGGGAHYFSRTLDEHNRAVREFILKKP